MSNQNRNEQSLQNYLDHAELRFQADMEQERFMSQLAHSSTVETTKRPRASKFQLVGAGVLTLVALGGGGKALLQQGEQHFGPIGGQAVTEHTNSGITKSIENAGGIKGGTYTPNPNELNAPQRSQIAMESGQNQTP
ncbi:hypothetical protein KW803_01505 [Candidatus Saccharibacteria bacterium]|nr:hypothetical protein [Candidatus Saccharibacteria bacterium]